MIPSDGGSESPCWVKLHRLIWLDTYHTSFDSCIGWSIPNGWIIYMDHRA